MTLNLTSQYYSTSRDFAVIENDPNDVAAIETTFEADFTNAAITPPDGDDLVWSPTNSQSCSARIINAAQHSLLVENEEMSDTNIVNALVSAATRGVLVQIAMTNDDNDYSSEFKQLVAAGAEVGTYAETASLYIHAKVILADYGSSGRPSVHRLGELLQRLPDGESRVGADYLESGDHGVDLQHVNRRLHGRHALVREQGQLLGRSQFRLHSR